jgi:hypothetical protein
MKNDVNVLSERNKRKDLEKKFFLQCFGSGMFIPDPDFYPSRILDPGSRIQKLQRKRGVKKISCETFFCSHKFPKFLNYFIFEMLKKKNFKEL